MIEIDTATPATSDYRRDRWGRPLIVPKGGGKAKPYTRTSSAAKTIEDTYNLELWARRGEAYGMAHDASLVARVLAIGGDPSTWDQAQKKAVNTIVEDAQKVAQAHKAADIGTAIHALTEQVDRGQPVSAGPYAADIEAYVNGLVAAELSVRPEWVECRMVCDTLEMAGTADRILVSARSALCRIGDVKTSASVDFGGLGWAAQLAAYAHSELYDVDTEERLPTPEIDKEVGYIIHLPAGRGECHIYEVDLVAGYKAAQLANEIRATRKASKKWITPLTSSSVPVPPAGTDPSAGGAPSTAAAPPPAAEPHTARLAGVAGATPTAPAAVGADRRSELMVRYLALNDADKAAFKAKKLPKDDLDAIEAALNDLDPFSIVVPLTPTVPGIPANRPPLPIASEIDEGGVKVRAKFDELKARVDLLSPERKSWVEQILVDAHRAAVRIWPWPKKDGTRRGYHLLDGVVNLAEGGHDDDEMARELAATAADSDAPYFAKTAGQAVGILSVDEALTFAALCSVLCHDVAQLPELRARPEGTAA